MPHYYAASGNAIQLDEASDALGVRFDGKAGPAMAKKATRSVAQSVTRGTAQPPVAGFGRFMLLHDPRAPLAPVETVVNALPRRLAARVSRTMPVFVERKSQLQAGRHRTDPGVIQAAARRRPVVSCSTGSA